MDIKSCLPAQVLLDHDQKLMVDFARRINYLDWPVQELAASLFVIHCMQMRSAQMVLVNQYLKLLLI